MLQGIPPRGMQHMTSQDLTGLARAALVGSSDDRDRFLNACRQYAFAAAIRFGRRHHGAEDSAQEAVVVVYRLLKLKPPELDPETVGALVHVVVLRHVNRAACSRRLDIKAVRELSAARREAPDVAREIETEELGHQVRAAIETLPQRLRAVIHLRHGEDLSTREIAGEVGRSQRSIIRLLREAEIALKDKLRRLGIRENRGGTFAGDADAPSSPT